MKVIKYFAYGSNMDPDRMRERGVNFLSRKKGILHGWRLEFNKVASDNQKKGYANIVEDRNSTVEGCLYEIEENDLKRLDKYEGFPDHYNRYEIEVETPEGKVRAITYIAHPNKIKEGLKPDNDYLEHLLKGKDCLSDKYFEKLKAIKTLD